MATRRLVIKPLFGLGNRMMAMASASRLARTLECELAIEWFQNNEMSTPFADLFDEPGIKLLSEEETRHFQHYDLMTSGQAILDIDELRRHDEVKITAFSVFFLTGDPVDLSRSVFGNNVFYQDVAFEVGRHIYSFRASAEIRERLDQVGQERFAGSIGVHMRHHDTVDGGWVGSFTDIGRPLWHSICWSLLRNFPDRNIFLSSNSQADYDLFAEVGEGRVFHHPKSSLDRTQSDTQKDALVDMMLLGRTSLLVRSGSSTFAYVPALAHQVPQLVLRGKGHETEVESILCDVEIDRGRPLFSLKPATNFAEALARTTARRLAEKG